MIVDYHTLTDLGVTAADAEPSLFSLIDGTWTEQGRVRLGELLRIPLSTADAIRERQHALRRLAPLVPQLRGPYWAELLPAVRGYLDSRYEAMPANRVANWRVRRRYADLATRLGIGVRATSRLMELAASAAVRVRHSGRDSPVLTKIADDLDAPTREPALAPVLAVPGGDDGRFAVTRHDSALRVRYRPLLDAMVAAVGELDALQAMALANLRPGWSVPEIDEGETATLRMEDLRHPLLPDGVANDVVMDAHRVLFLTGPNMAGKTTLLRACGLAVHLAHCGMALPARVARIPVFDRLHGALTVRDSIERGESYFLAEVRRVAALVDRVAAGERVFGVIDEMFRGTNVLDATDATALVCRGLARATSGCFLVASHLSELAESLALHPAICAKQMEVVPDAQGPRPTFRLRAGVSRQRLGMHLLEREGVVQMLSRVGGAAEGDDAGGGAPIVS